MQAFRQANTTYPPVHNYASPILDLTDMQIQIEEENMQK